MPSDMSQPSTPPGPDDFDALYRGDFEGLTPPPAAPGQQPGFRIDRVPWDIGEAQPVVRQLEADGAIASEVLDIGCGPGENAIFLADRGYRVCGLDAAPAAIDIARARGHRRGLATPPEFAVADATDLKGDYAGRFATIVDSALYHCFPEDRRARYTASLHDAGRADARLHVLCFSDRVPDEFPGPFRITEANLRSTLTDTGWHVRRVERTQYTTALTRDDLEAQPSTPLAALAAELGFDDRGRLLAPAWLATAERR